MSAYACGAVLGSVHALAGRIEKKDRVRIGQHPEPGGLFHPAKRIREEMAGWQRIGRVSVQSAELGRRSSYSLTPLARRSQTATTAGA